MKVDLETVDCYALPRNPTTRCHHKTGVAFAGQPLGSNPVKSRHEATQSQG